MNTPNAPDAPAPDLTLIDFIDAEFTVEGPADPSSEKTLSDALSGREGVKTLAISGGKVIAEYDPAQITKAELAEAITNAGFRVKEIDSAAASPLSDVLHDTPPPAS